MLKLYHGTTSVCAAKVRLVLHEKDLEWSGKLLDLQRGDQYSPEYLALNPNGVVPTLVHDDRVLIESSVIMFYLDETFPQPPLQPARPDQRARMRLWMKLVDEKLHNAIGLLTFAAVHRHNYLHLTSEELTARFSKVRDAELRVRQVEAVLHGLDSAWVTESIRLYDKALQSMEEALTHDPWLAGDVYSLADAALTPYVNRLEMLGMSALWRSSRPRVASWLERVRDRRSFEKALTAYFTDADRARYVVDEDEIGRKIDAALSSSSALRA